jgi:hypothetical protein
MIHAQLRRKGVWIILAGALCAALVVFLIPVRSETHRYHSEFTLRVDDMSVNLADALERALGRDGVDGVTNAVVRKMSSAERHAFFDVLKPNVSLDEKVLAAVLSANYEVKTDQAERTLSFIFRHPDAAITQRLAESYMAEFFIQEREYSIIQLKIDAVQAEREAITSDRQFQEIKEAILAYLKSQNAEGISEEELSHDIRYLALATEYRVRERAALESQERFHLFISAVGPKVKSVFSVIQSPVSKQARIWAWFRD